MSASTRCMCESLTLAEVNWGKPGAACLIDERAGFVEGALDVAPSAHHDFELFELAARIGAGQDDHAGAVVTDRGDFPGVLLDVAVSGDHQPLPTSGLRKPIDVQGARLDRGWRSLLPEDDAAWIAGERDVAAETGQDSGEAEQVGVDVEPNRRRLSARTHAARALS